MPRARPGDQTLVKAGLRPRRFCAAASVVAAAFRSAALVVLVLGVASPPISRIAAQSPGALYLRLPVSARSVGAGDATTADTLGVDAPWVNPAALAALTSREVALFGGTSIVVTSVGATVAVPSAALGTLALSALQADFGDQSLTDENGSTTGTITNRAWLVMASYATAIGSNLRLGLSYRFSQFSFNCTGLCGPIPSFGSAGGSLDAGVQLVVPERLTRTPVTLGLAVRNIGPDVQVKDAEQADPPPRTMQAGVRVRVPLRALDESGGSLELSTDVVTGVGQTQLGVRTGAQLEFRGVAALRLGYSRSEYQSLAGPSIGASLRPAEQMTIDIARRFDTFSSEAGQQPTYFSLRFRF